MLVNKVYCPTCGSHNDGHTCVTDGTSTPNDGDISICAYCGTISKYIVDDTTISLGEFAEDEVKEIMKSPEIQEAMAMARFISAGGRG